MEQLSRKIIFADDIR